MVGARRAAVRVSGAVVSLLLVVVAGLAGCGARRVDTVDKVQFSERMAVPPLADSRVVGGERVFDLHAKAGRTDFGRGRRTATWGFNGTYLGPTIRARRGESVRINVRNGLGEPTTVHWHGMHLPARMDGGPHQMVRPGSTWSPRWRIDQPAASLWYHPHPHGRTEDHIHRGLAGMFIVDDDRERRLALPRSYGVDDLPVIVQDRSFGGDGQFKRSRNSVATVGFLGDTLLVNGTVGPYVDVSTERVRLRLLNASTARTYRFEFSDGRRFHVIGSDGGLLERPHRTTEIQLTPGERAEIVVAVRPRERVVLRSVKPDLGGGFTDRFAGGADRFDVLQLRAAARLADSPDVPGRLVPVERLSAGSSVAERDFVLAGNAINEKTMDMGRIDAAVRLDTVETWNVSKPDGTPHNFHVHGVQFQVLRVGRDEPPPELRGWKDTVQVSSDRPVQLIMRFTDYADPDMPYMFHCHLVYHEDQGMMGQFVVLREGMRAGRPPVGRHGEHGG